MGSQHKLDVASGDAIVIVTRAATLRVDCYKMEKDWSLRLRYRADSQPPSGRKDAGQRRPLEGQAGAISVAGGPGYTGQADGSRLIP